MLYQENPDYDNNYFDDGADDQDDMGGGGDEGRCDSISHSALAIPAQRRYGYLTGFIEQAKQPTNNRTLLGFLPTVLYALYVIMVVVVELVTCCNVKAARSISLYAHASCFIRLDRPADVDDFYFALFFRSMAL